MRRLFLIPLFLSSASISFALNASDSASNYGGDWTDGSNAGTGFLDWSISSNGGTGGSAGVFIGDSTAGAGDVNTGGSSFGIYANGAADSSVEAIRSFSSALSTNDQFSFDFAVNFTDGNRGFNLRTGGSSIVGLNIFTGDATVSTSFTNTPSVAQTFDYGGGDQMLRAVILVISPSSVNYQISRTSSEGNQGILFAGSVSEIVGSIDNFNFYINGDASPNSDPENLYFNKLEVIPESSTYGLILATLALATVARRR